MTRFRKSFLLAVGLLVAVSLVLGRVEIGPVFDQVSSRLAGLGPLGPVLLGLVYIVSTLLLLPGSGLTLAIGATLDLPTALVTVSLASTTSAGLAFLVARHLARTRISEWASRTPRFAAVDEAITREGWRVVALLRLSPLIPFSLGNYLFGLTGVRFWPYLLASWIAMLPGTFLYVAMGRLARLVVAGDEPLRDGRVGLLVVGAVATVLATVVVARRARQALERRQVVPVVDDRDPGRDAESP